MAMTCIFDNAPCESLGECMACTRFPGEEAAGIIKAGKADPLEALIKERNCLQIDPSQYAGRVVLQWDDAVYGYGPTPDIAMAQADYKLREMYDFAVRYHEFMTQ